MSAGRDFVRVLCRGGELMRVGNYWLVFFFFFQAEDGIRDYKVTGVQTCALPILDVPESGGTAADGAGRPLGSGRRAQHAIPALALRPVQRRVRAGEQRLGCIAVVGEL